jgi:sugar lactone lactonase YvrE
VFTVVGVVIAGLIGYGILGPDRLPPSDPWIAPAPPKLEGVLRPNARLERARPLAKGKLYGPESITLGSDGRVYTGSADGRVLKIDIEKDTVETFVRTGEVREGCGKDPNLESSCGRPLGMRFDKDRNLIVADSGRGLLSVAPDGNLTRLSTGAKGIELKFADDLDIASDGAIYFSDASTKHSRGEYRDDIIENRPYGRLLRYLPREKKTEVLLEGLYFANGVQLSKDEDYVLVVETSRYRIRRYYLKGPKAGTDDVFVDNLPGFPDNIRRGSSDTYWVALGAKRSAIMDTMHAHPGLKSFVSRVVPLETLQNYVVPKIGLVISLDQTGKIVESLWDQTGSFARQLSEANELGGRLFLGSVDFDRIAVLELAADQAQGGEAAK